MSVVTSRRRVMGMYVLLNTAGKGHVTTSEWKQVTINERSGKIENESKGA